MAIGFIGGNHHHKAIQKLYRYIANKTPAKLKIAIIPFATHPRDIKWWNRRVRSVFRPFGIEYIQTIHHKTTHESAKKAILLSNVLYFTGGKPDQLIERLRVKNLVGTIQSYRGHIIGYSAGALALCQDCLITKDHYYHHSTITTGLGLVPFSIEVHYTHRKRSELMLFSDRSIFALPNGSGLVFDNGQLTPFGDVFVFGNVQSQGMTKK